jgi:hypothetical protein
VEVGGLAPGRQVRCGFCHRLLEVPFLPRATAATWKRRRFGTPKWVVWSWTGLGVAAAIVLGAAMILLVKQHHHSSRERSIRELLDSAKRHERAGRVSQALLDMDTALELARQSDGGAIAPQTDIHNKRAELARRDAKSVLDRLNDAGPSAFQLGDWLNLLARAQDDPDLKPMLPEIRGNFATSLEHAIAAKLVSARKAMESGRVVAALDVCDQLPVLTGHLAKASQDRIRRELEQLVEQLVGEHGVSVEPPEGEYTFGSQGSYVKQLLPLLVPALESKAYLPYRRESPWRDAWRHACYRVHVKVIERLEGNYLSSANRVTRITAQLTLTSGDEVRWQTSPTARTTVPLPKLSALVASRAAVSSKPSEEVERLLYADARGQIDDRFAVALTNMPAWRPKTEVR